MNHKSSNDLHGWQVLSVGKLMPSGQTRYPEGVHYEYSQAGHWVVVSYGAPSAAEIAAVNRGAITWAVRSYPGLTALYFRPDPLPWQEAYFELGRVTDTAFLASLATAKLPSDPILRADGKWNVDPMNIVLVDAFTGIIRALRLVGPPHVFMRHLAQSIRSQVQGPRVSQDQVSATIRELQRRSPSELGPAALARMR
jgi:hypothetical protein